MEHSVSNADNIPAETPESTDAELLAAAEPEDRELAERFSDLVTNRLARITWLEEAVAELQRQVDERDEEYERGWVNGAARTAEALGTQPAEPEPINPRRLVQQVAELEGKVADLMTLAKVFATPDDEHPIGRRVAALEATVADIATAESIVSRATGTEYSDQYLAGYADGLAGRMLQQPEEPGSEPGDGGEPS